MSKTETTVLIVGAVLVAALAVVIVATRPKPQPQGLDAGQLIQLGTAIAAIAA